MKIGICMFVCILVLAALAGCSGGSSTEPGTGADQNVYEQTLKEAADINKNCNLGFAYMSFSEVPEDEAREWFGIDHPEAKTTDDGYVHGFYFNYPYDSADRRLTQIYIEGGDYDFYGIKVGDDLSKVEPILTEKGYVSEDNMYIEHGANYIKYHVYTGFITEENSSTIIGILISFYDPNEPVPDEIN